MYPFKWASYIFINTGKFVCVFSDVEFTCRYRCWSKYTWRSTWRFFKRWPCIKHLFAYLFLCGIRRTKVWKSILISIIISHFMLDVGLKGFLRWLLANGIHQLWYRVAESRVVYKSRLPVNFAGFSGRFCRLLSLFHESRYVEGMMFITSHNRLLSTKLGLLKNLTKMLILPPVSQTTWFWNHLIWFPVTFKKLEVYCFYDCSPCDFMVTMPSKVIIIIPDYPFLLKAPHFELKPWSHQSDWHSHSSVETTGVVLTVLVVQRKEINAV